MINNYSIKNIKNDFQNNNENCNISKTYTAGIYDQNYFNNNDNDNYNNNNNENNNMNIRRCFAQNEKNIINISLYSDQLNKISTRNVDRGQKLNEVFQAFLNDQNNDWINQNPIDHFEVNGMRLNLEGSLEEQGIFKDTYINIVFKNK